MDERGTTPEMASVGIRWIESVEMPARPEYVGVVRRRLKGLAHDVGFTDDEGVEIAIAVSEALSNAVEHARTAGEASVDICCTADLEGIEVVVRDQGAIQWNPGVVPEATDPLDSLEGLSQRGRGLIHMQAFMDEMEIHVSPEGTEVRLRRRRKPAN
ncbi:MAG TPA: ATP-binding protein [Armatimonadota bacterium]|nr:ATP-binding protein [Armatimonadota bacterium]